MFPSKLLAVALVVCAALRDGISQGVVPPSRNARVTLACEQLPAPSRQSVVRAQPDIAERMREAMHHLDAARRTPRVPYPPPQPTRAFCGTPDGSPWPSPPFDSSDNDALTAFAAAAACCPTAAAAVLADALVADEERIARRALLGVLRGWRTDNCGEHRLTAQLLFLSGETRWDEASNHHVAEWAIGLLSQQIMGPTSERVRTTLVQEVMRDWPLRNEDLILPWDTGRLPCRHRRRWFPPEYTRAPRMTRLILIAAMTGDRSLIDRLVPEGTDPTAQNPASPSHPRFVLRFMALAAPHVDAETARRLHAWYMPHVLGSLDLGIPANCWRTRENLWRVDALDVVMAIHPRVPDSLLASYEPLFTNRLLAGEVRERWPAARRR